MGGKAEYSAPTPEFNGSKKAVDTWSRAWQPANSAPPVELTEHERAAVESFVYGRGVGSSDTPVIGAGGVDFGGAGS